MQRGPGGKNELSKPREDKALLLSRTKNWVEHCLWTAKENVTFSSLVETDWVLTYFCWMVEHLFHVVRMRVVVPISWGRAKRHLYPGFTLMTRIMGPVGRVHGWLSRWIKAGCSYSEEAQCNVMLMKTKLNGRKSAPVDVFPQYGRDRNLYFVISFAPPQKKQTNKQTNKQKELWQGHRNSCGQLHLP